MHFLPVTSVTAFLLALIYVVLTVRVIMGRGSTGISLGAGGGDSVRAGEESTVPMLVRVRSHANFAEYVPFCLVLLGLAEVNATPRWALVTLGAMLVIGRILHPIGMGQKIPNPFRAGGLVLTLLTIVGAAAAIVVAVLR